MDTSSTPPLKWQLSQCFGGGQDTIADVADADLVSACDFDPSGRHLAAGDNGGRVVVWEKEDHPKPRRNGFAPPMEFRFFCEFKSHDPEFDFLKSVEIEERINQIKWVDRPSDGWFLLTTNDRTVKLWKIYEKSFYDLTAPNDTDPGIIMPQLEEVERATVAKPRGVYQTPDTTQLHSISPCSDGSTFLSSDDFRVNLWDYNDTLVALNVLDIRPPSTESVEDTITTAAFHPTKCNEFLYGTSDGAVMVCDTRTRLNCRRPAQVFEYDEPNRTIFTDLISSVTAAHFHPPDHNLIVARDYMTVKLWDRRKDDEPRKIIRVHDEFRGLLGDLYESDCIYDKFECSSSPDGKHIVTGSYNNRFLVFPVEGGAAVALEASSSVRRKKKKALMDGDGAHAPQPTDFRKKGLHVAWHPHHPLLSLCTTNNLFIYGVGQTLGRSQVKL